MYSIAGKKRFNSRKYDKVIFEAETEQEIKDFMKEKKLIIKEVPYFFSHIVLSDDTIIRQTFRGLTCSPTKLLEVLKN